MLNQCNFIGNVGKEPEIRSMQSGAKVANFSLAVTEKWTDKTTGEKKSITEWVNIVVFGDGLVKVVENYIRKGSALHVCGKMKTRSWEDQSGVKKYKTEIVVQGIGGSIEMVGGKSENASPSVSAPAPQQNAFQTQADDELENEIPF